MTNKKHTLGAFSRPNSDGIILLDSHTKLVESANREAHELLNIPAGELVGKDARELPIDSSASFFACIDGDNEVSKPGSFATVPHSESIEVFAMTLKILSQEKLIVILRDVSESRQIEEQIREYQKRVAVKQFATDVGHCFEQCIPRPAESRQ